MRAPFSRLLLPLLVLPLAACVSLDDWSEAPGYRYYDGYAHAPGWYGGNIASVDLFYGSLSSHGIWRTDPRHGRVWSPHGVGPGWRPYMYGRWDNQRWISSEPFGWATYHYGRWGHDSRGWFWVPGTRYAPSWVEWRREGQRRAWAPLPPSGWNRQRPEDRWIHNVRPGRPAVARPPAQARPRPGRIRPDRPRTENIRPGRPRQDMVCPTRPRSDSARPERPRGNQVRPGRTDNEVRSPRRPRGERASPERRQQMRQEWRARGAQARDAARERPARPDRGWQRGPGPGRER